MAFGECQKSIFLFCLIGCLPEVTAMGKLREKKWDWLRLGALPLVLAGAFLCGGLLGCLYANRLTDAGGSAVAAYVSDWLALLRGGELETAFLPVLRDRMLLWLAVTVCGLTGLGLIGVPVLCAGEGFFLCYAGACFCRSLGGQGIAAAVILFGLPALVWLPVLLMLGCQSMKSARILLGRVLGENSAGPVFSRSYWLRVLLGAAGMVGCAGVEYAVVPALLGTLARLLR